MASFSNFTQVLSPFLFKPSPNCYFFCPVISLQIAPSLLSLGPSTWIHTLAFYLTYTKGNNLTRFSLLSMFYFFSPVYSHYTNFLSFHFHYATTLLKLYNGSSFSKRLGFPLLLVLSPRVIFPIPTVQCLSSFTTHQTELATVVHWTHFCTFLF